MHLVVTGVAWALEYTALAVLSIQSGWYHLRFIGYEVFLLFDSLRHSCVGGEFDVRVLFVIIVRT